MEIDEDHRETGCGNVTFDIELFDDVVKIKVEADIFETEEGAEVESMNFYIYDHGLLEWVNVSDEFKKTICAQFYIEIEDKALEKWEAQK